MLITVLHKAWNKAAHCFTAKLKRFDSYVFINQPFTNAVYKNIKTFIRIKKQKEQSKNIIIFQASNHAASNGFAGFNHFFSVP